MLFVGLLFTMFSNSQVIQFIDLEIRLVSIVYVDLTIAKHCKEKANKQHTLSIN